MAASVEDWLAIHDLFVRYAGALDGGDVETVVACFTEDATLESLAIGAISGTDAIRAFAGQFAARRSAGIQFRHFVTNLTVDVADGEARATAYLLVAISRGGTHRTLPPGQYDCALVRQDGAWRFRRRTVTHDHAYTLD